MEVSTNTNFEALYELKQKRKDNSNDRIRQYESQNGNSNQIMPVSIRISKFTA